MQTMRRPQLGLHTKLVLLVLTVLVPLMVLQVAGIISRFESRTQRELQASQELAEATSVAFTNYLHDLWNSELALGLAMSLEEKPLSSAQMESLMCDQLPAYQTVSQLEWLNPHGIVVASTNPAARGLSCADRSHVREIIGGKPESISDLLISRLKPGRVQLMVARGIRHHKRLQGIVVATVMPTELDHILPLQRTGRSSVGLVDRNALMVYRSRTVNLPMNRRRVGQGSPSGVALRGQPATVRRFWGTVDRDLRMGAAVPIPEIGWAAFASAPLNEVLEEAKAISTREIVVLIVTVVLSLGAALWIGNAFLAPVTALRGAALAISKGDFAARVNPKGQDELAVAVRTFDQMAARIQDLEQSRTRFLQVAAHELRNPMAAVKAICSLLRLRATQNPPNDDKNNLVAIMEHEVDRLAHLLNEILEAFLSREGRIALKFGEVDLAAVVHSALQPFAASPDGHTFVLEGVLPGRTVVWGDYQRLEEVVRNLLSNAVKYSLDGGKIKMSLDTIDEKALLKVSDPGLGIPKNQLDKVFEGFHRATNLAGRDPGGIGLGLRICRDIVEQHRGRIWAESEEGEGTTILVELPLEKPGEAS